MSKQESERFSKSLDVNGVYYFEKPREDCVCKSIRREQRKGLEFIRILAGNRPVDLLHHFYKGLNHIITDSQT